MAKYRPIFINIWVCDEKFQDYSVEGKLLFLYLITNSHLNESGIYRITYKTISNETDISKDKVVKLIKESLNNNISYDEKKNVIFVHKFLKYNGSGNPELIKKSIERDRILIKTTLWKVFNKYYTSDLVYIENDSETISSIPIPIPISNTISKEEYPTEFESFWEKYPNHKQKQDAYDSWKELNKTERSEVEIAAENYAIECINNKEELKYIKHGSSFCRKKKRRWKDYLIPIEPIKKVGESQLPKLTSNEKEKRDKYYDDRIEKERELREKNPINKAKNADEVNKINKMIQDEMVKWHKNYKEKP